MGVMSLAASLGSELTLNINGPDEQSMTEALVSLVNQRFYEAE
jgi:phosphocarrier protein